MSNFEIALRKAVENQQLSLNAAKDTLLKDFAVNLKSAGEALPSEDEIVAKIVAYLLKDVKLTGWMTIFGFMLNALVTAIVKIKLAQLDTNWYRKLQSIFGI